MASSLKMLSLSLFIVVLLFDTSASDTTDINDMLQNYHPNIQQYMRYFKVFGNVTGALLTAFRKFDVYIDINSFNDGTRIVHLWKEGNKCHKYRIRIPTKAKYQHDMLIELFHRETERNEPWGRVICMNASHDLDFFNEGEKLKPQHYDKKLRKRIRFARFSSLKKKCENFAYDLIDYYGSSLVKAQVEVIDNKENATGLCLSAITSFDPHGVNVMNPVIPREYPPFHTRPYYYNESVPAEFNKTVTFLNGTYVGIKIDTLMKFPKRWVFIPPYKAEHFPALYMDFPIYCKDVRVQFRLFDNIHCDFYLYYRSHYFHVSKWAIEMRHIDHIIIEGEQVRDYIIYYRLGRIYVTKPFDLPTEVPTNRSFELELCPYRNVEETFSFTVMNITMEDYMCKSFWMYTGPGVKIELHETPTTTTTRPYIPPTTTTSTRRARKTTTPLITTTAISTTIIQGTTETFEAGDLSPFLFGILDLVIVIGAAIGVIYAVRRSWWKDSRKAQLNENAFAHHWNFGLEPPKAESSKAL